MLRLCSYLLFSEGRSFVGERTADLWTSVGTVRGKLHSWASLMDPFDSAVVWNFLRYLLTGRGKSNEISVINN